MPGEPGSWAALVLAFAFGWALWRTLPRSENEDRNTVREVWWR